MEESEHALAARRHADKAMSGSGGDVPAVLASLAQTEALLAVATAIDRLAEALGGRDAPQPSLAQGQAYQVAGVRREYPNASLPWTAESDAALLSAYQSGHDAVPARLPVSQPTAEDGSSHVCPESGLTTGEPL